MANARFAYAAYEEVFVAGARYTALKADGARVQRPLWASTGVKNPDYSDTLCVTELVAPNTVNTMPDKTLDAVADHGVITGDTVTGTASAAQQVFDKLSAVGIDLVDVFEVLESEGVAKFEASWKDLLDATQTQLDALKPTQARPRRATGPRALLLPAPGGYRQRCSMYRLVTAMSLSPCPSAVSSSKAAFTAGNKTACCRSPPPPPKRSRGP